MPLYRTSLDLFGREETVLPRLLVAIPLLVPLFREALLTELSSVFLLENLEAVALLFLYPLLYLDEGLLLPFIRFLVLPLLAVLLPLVLPLLAVRLPLVLPLLAVRLPLVLPLLAVLLPLVLPLLAVLLPLILPLLAVRLPLVVDLLAFGYVLL